MAYHVHISDKAAAPEYLSALHGSLDSGIDVSIGPEIDAPERTQALVSGWPSEGVLDRLAKTPARNSPKYPFIDSFRADLNTAKSYHMHLRGVSMGFKGVYLE